MRKLCMALVMAAVWHGALSAQDPMMRQRRQLQQQVFERLLQNGRIQAGLSDEQLARHREIVRRSFTGRDEVQAQERELWRALEDQMRPGVAADEDSVSRLIDTLIAFPARLVDQARAEQREYAEFLTPVQRAQLLLLQRRFQNAIEQIMHRRGPGMMGQQPGRLP